MDVIVGKVRNHLEDVKSKNADLKPEILSELDSSLCRSLPTSDAVDIIARVASILRDLQQDATQLTELAERVAENAPITLEDILAVVPTDSIQAGLEIALPASINKVSLALLSTTKSETEISIIASKEKLVISLINLWLRTEDIGVAEKAWQLISGLLGVNVNRPTKTQGAILRTIDTGSNLMWRRLITDQNIYGLLFSLTSLSTVGQPGQLSRRAKGVSQFRLMELVITFWPVKSLWTSSLPEINKLYGLKADEGLIHYCLLHMVDAKDDFLERIQLIENAYSRFLKISRWNDPLTGISPNLEFLIQHGIHGNLLEQFTHPDQNDPLQGLFQSAIVIYVDTYVAFYPQHFLDDSTGTKHQIWERILKVLNSTSPNTWARNEDPTGLLGLVARLPRESFFTTTLPANPILSLPLRPFNIRIATCLAVIFLGVNLEPGEETVNAKTEAVAARCLFFIYLGANEMFFDDIIANASLVATPDVAQRAFQILYALAKASWNQKESLPANTSSGLPGEESLRSQCRFYSHTPLPADGALALLTPPALNLILPITVSSSQHLTGDAYPVARTKFDLVVALSQRMENFVAPTGMEDDKGWAAVKEVLKIRLRNGTLGRGVELTTKTEEDAVPTVATMSR